MDKNKTLPSNCVSGGVEGTLTLNIGRKQIEKELVVGKVISDWHSGYCKINCLMLKFYVQFRYFFYSPERWRRASFR